MCYSCDRSVTDKLFSQWFLAMGTLPPLTLPRCHFLEAHAITCFWWLSSTLLPLELHGWKPNSISFISDFHSFFLSLCSTPLLSFSLCCVLISPTPLLCHQLAPSVSKSWSHSACIALFLFLITHMYAWAVVAFHKHIHRTNIGHAYLHCYYQPLTSSGSLNLLPHFFQGVQIQYDWHAVVQKLKLRRTLRHPAN